MNDHPYLNRPGKRIIVAGSRTVDDYLMVRQELDKLLDGCSPECIISGTARGADRMGERYAEERGIPVERYPADWDQFGKSAGYIRNKQMASVADTLIAFHRDGSRGTQHMINIARERGLNVFVVSC